jgi:L-ascorbate metabolism protein UlaG (beta-lactamase superfamily)
MIYIVAFVIVFLLVLVYIFLQQPQFGSVASREKLKRSPNYREGQFKNVMPTPQLTGDASVPKVMKEFFFQKDKRNKPSAPLPSVKTNLMQLDPDEDVLVWFGHSSYFMQLDGKNFLIDPVFSGHASPVFFTTRSFAGTDNYSVEDMPAIDYLLLTHDHYDHLDYKTIQELRPKIKKVITGLGVGAHLERWGYESSTMKELDWDEFLQLENGFTIHTTTARHFSGRNFKRNSSLWLSMILTTPTFKIFVGGDSGYGTHFKAIGEQFGPFDLAILENGQYNKYWRHIHMFPEETVQAAIDLKAKKLLPLHWGKFALSLHAWDEPIIRVTEEAGKKNVTVVHPMIGEVLNLKTNNTTSRWWESVE